ncbi:hypothetical protein [Marimonas arenosa]|uniref:Uncharacterized protein n=1 Tax=Marimonas arenosa TaxID=1795305 RepID=A0AAE4B5M7_9RHOB|nr:hypothetical protein [Marimonas arenosa]MDQ2089406.1 hypothetical protein [Marimonas arenosa]
MLSSLVLVKVAVTLAVVVGLTLIAEHVSARLAGLLAGFPHGIAIVLYFIGHEQGVGFATAAAMAAVGGLAANMAHALGFAALARGRGWAAAMRAGIGAIVAFLTVAALMRVMAPGPLAGAAITAVALLGAAAVMRGADDAGVAEKPRLTFGALLLRAGVAAALVTLITGIASAVGPYWAGLLSGFPVVTFPLLLLIQARHGRAPVTTMVKAYPFGLTALIVYTLSVAWAFPRLGMGWGTLAGLTASLVWMATATRLRAVVQNRLGMSL